MAHSSDPTILAADLREALRPLWRRFSAHRTLSQGKVGVLFHLERRGPLAAADLAGLERISHQAVANAVREMEDLGLLSRSPDPTDGRRALVHLTDAGRDRLRREREAGQDWLIHAIAEQLSPAELDTLAAAVPLLRRLDAETGRAPGAAAAAEAGAVTPGAEAEAGAAGAAAPGAEAAPTDATGATQ